MRAAVITAGVLVCLSFREKLPSSRWPNTVNSRVNFWTCVAFIIITNSTLWREQRKIAWETNGLQRFVHWGRKCIPSGHNKRWFVVSRTDICQVKKIINASQSTNTVHACSEGETYTPNQKLFLHVSDHVTSPSRRQCQFTGRQHAHNPISASIYTSLPFKLISRFSCC